MCETGRYRVHLGILRLDELGAPHPRFIGFAGVAHPTFLPALAARPELGWRLARDAWGRGLATEAATAARDHAFATLGLPELISIIHPDNTRSRRVATKLGMTLAERVHVPALDRDAGVWVLAAPRSSSGLVEYDPHSESLAPTSRGATRTMRAPRGW